MHDLLGIDNVVFPVGDLAQARTIYSDQLGLVESFAVPEVGMIGYLLGTEGPGLVLRHAEEADHAHSHGPRLLLEVRDARETYARLEATVTLTGPLHEGHTGFAFEFVDPWGNALGFVDYVFAPEQGRAHKH